MKKLLVLAFAVSMSSMAMAQEKSMSKTAPASSANSLPVTGPRIAWEESQHDFGTITEGDKVEYAFKFKNSGNEPLILQNVQTTCGCTVPTWPKEPIAPGKSGVIKASFNSAGKAGQQNKVITIISNAKEGNSQVSILANVKAKEVTPATTTTPEKK
jgi:hypothetical protein